MKKNIVILLGFLLFMVNCKTGQVQNEKSNLSELEFSKKIKDSPNATLIDVRTPDEFSGGHLINAQNIDWNGDSFSEQISKLDKTKPMLVYCRSGSRSAAAAAQMRSDGYKEVYEMSGGIMAWIGANLPVTTEK